MHVCWLVEELVHRRHTTGRYAQAQSMYYQHQGVHQIEVVKEMYSIFGVRRMLWLPEAHMQ